MKKRLLLLTLIPFLTGCNLFNSSSSSASESSTSSDSRTSESTSSDTNSSSEDTSSSSESSSSSDSSSSSSESSSSQGSSVFDNENELYDAFFSPDSKIELELDFTNESIYNLAQYGDGKDTNFDKKEMYHPCDLKVTINDVSKSFHNVGARMKGNTSRNPSFVNENGIFDKAAYRWCHMKLSFTQTFDDPMDNDYYTETWTSSDARKARKDRKFGGMKKFDIKWNKNYDNAYTREIYSYQCLQDEGILSGKANLAKVTVKSESDTFVDFFNIMECIDKQMLKRHFKGDAKDGDLYKCSWPISLQESNSIGVESATFTPLYAIKTNEDTSDYSVLKNALRVINTPGSAEDAKSSLEEVVDIDAFLKYSAMMWVIGNPDDLRNNTNNSYFYFDGVTNKMYAIPYDNDRCFGIMQDWPCDTKDIPYTTTKVCGQDRAWNQNNLLWRTIIEEHPYYEGQYQSNSQYFPVIQEWKEQYEQYCVEYATKYLSVNRYKEFNDRFYYANKDIENGGRDNYSFEQYATAKLNTL